MVDTVTKERRSQIMRNVRSKNTRPEMVVRKLIHSMGFRFRLHRTDLPGKPDIVFPRFRSVIFVHGCFWHRHKGCASTRTPKTRVKFWESKFKSNELRDQIAKHLLGQLNWRVMTIWECEIANTQKLVKQIYKFLNGV
jgi:DNA mismatch endonuclease (patch repair protein)